MLVSSSGVDQTKAAARRLTHYGKYSYLEFKNGRNVAKKIQSTQSGLRFVLEELPVGPASDVFATIPRGRYEQLAARIEKQPELTAPIPKGTRVGDIVVTLVDEEVTRVPLVALQDVGEGGLWQKAKDSLLQMF